MSNMIIFSGWCVVSKGRIISELYASKKNAEARLAEIKSVAGKLLSSSHVIFYEATYTTKELKAQMADFIDSDVVEDYIREHKV